MKPLIGLIFLLFFLQAKYVLAENEYWKVFQVKINTPSAKSLNFEFVNRDFYPTNDNNLRLIRLMYGGDLGSFKFLIGGALADSKSSADERRLQQYLTHTTKHDSYYSLFLRLGIEERFFNNDPNLYFRFRFKAQINPLFKREFGPSFYNETFFIPEGYKKFANQLNENRLGIGVRYNIKPFEIYLYQTFVYIKTIQEERILNWLQLQLILNFDV